MSTGWRRLALAAAALLLAGSACRFAARLPAVALGAEPLRRPAYATAATPQKEANSQALPSPTEPGAAGPDTQETSAPTPRAALILADVTSEETSDKPRYEIHARYPALEWGDDPRAQVFNKAAEKIALDEIRGFKESVYRLPSEAPFTELGSFLEIKFSPTASEKGILSVLYQISFYMAGAAHPGHYSYPLNFDLESGKVLALEDLFETSAAYLEALSKACVDDLSQRGQLEWEDGALPKADNYRVWNITPDGLLITFDEYQVASYAAGPQSVTVPYAQLKALLRKDSPLRRFLGE